MALAAGLALVPRAAPAISGEPDNASPATCTLEPGPIRTVARILDAETVGLDDGSEVRLIGALAPRASDASANTGAWPAEEEAKRILSELVLGHSVKLAYGGRHTDRYGRHLAHLFINDGGAEKWVQGELLAAGAARAYGLPGNFICAAELLANERLARTAGGGLWEATVYQPKPSRLTALLLARRSHYEIVEGTVASVSRSNSGLYLNFGSDWKTDFTLRIGKAVLASNSPFEQSLSAATGKRVSVRGWIERRNGPMIDVSDASQIEILDDVSPGPAPTAPVVSGLPGSGPAENANAPSPPARTDGSAAGAHKHKRPAIPDEKSPGAVDL
jgi:micrococcal nuclease